MRFVVFKFVGVIVAIMLFCTSFLSSPNSVTAEQFHSLISAPDGTLFLLYDNARHSVSPATLAALGITEQASRPVSRQIFDTYLEQPPVPDLPPGSLVAGPDGWPYLVLNGLHRVADQETFYANGWGGYQQFGPNAIAKIDPGLFALIPQRAPLAAAERTGPGFFDWGYCTWWVAQRRAVTWLGNAIEWYDNAAAQGYAVGKQPLPGAILVRGGAGGYGHVAYVESVDGTTFTVSEMNVTGLGQLSTRTYDMVSNPPPTMIGFVYWRFGEEPTQPAKEVPGALVGWNPIP